MEATRRIMVSREMPGRQGGWERWGTRSLLLAGVKVFFSDAWGNDFSDTAKLHTLHKVSVSEDWLWR